MVKVTLRDGSEHDYKDADRFEWTGDGPDRERLVIHAGEVVVAAWPWIECKGVERLDDAG